MSYTVTTAKPAEPDKYSRLRTQTELARNQYQAQANRELQRMVEAERRHLQAQVDQTVAEAQAAINQAYTEAEHWRQQCETIYQLLEDTTRQAEARIAELEAQLARRPEPEAKKLARTPKARQLERQRRQLGRLGRDEE